MKHLYRSKQLFCLLIMLAAICLCVSAAADVSLTKKHFPDKIFREWLRLNFDADGDQILSDEEIQDIGYINVDDMGIGSLKGIEYLTSLENLWCNGNELNELDLSHNPLVFEVHCSRNSLTGLDLTANPLVFLVECEDNNLKSLSFGHNEHLIRLLCGFNRDLTKLDIGNCPNLSQLLAYCIGIKELDLSGFPKLSEYIANGSPNNLAKIKLGSHPELRVFNCCAEWVTKLDFSGCPALKELTLSVPNLTSIRLGKKAELTDLTIVDTKTLKSIDITGCDKLIELTSKKPRPGMGYIYWQKGEYGTDSFRYCLLPENTKYINGLGEKISKLKLDREKAALTVGDTLKLKLTIKPADALNQPVSWKSSDKKVAVVDQEGNITTVGPGACTITCKAKSGKAKAACKVTVHNKLVSKIVLNKKSILLKKQKTYQLTVLSIQPADAFNQAVKWTTSNKKVATVDQNGLVTVVGKGTCIITCKATDGSGKKAVCEVTVK